jgi:hypothetical protein
LSGLDSVSCGLVDVEDEPGGEIASSSGRDNVQLGGLLGGALVISPFFFWGTSMTLMKVSSPSRDLECGGAERTRWT